MDYFREMVSGDKKRHQELNYNLDLSYITPRLIAMAFPASGIETVYRNNIKEVAQFIKQKHHNNFLVMNLSGRHYDYNKFDNQVEEFEWVDHHAPQLIILFQICHRIKQFLLQDKRNVVFVNCQAGKGRTGTIICCFLLFSGLFEDPGECFYYYSKKRFKKGEGVTQPSQRRYVNYFHQLLNSNYSYPYIINIVGIYIRKLPQKFEGKFKPFVQFHDKNKEMISYTNQKSFFEQKKIYTSQVDLISIMESTFVKEAKGDLTIKLYNNEIMKSKKIGRISFNTALIDPKESLLTFNLNEIDPDNLVNDKEMPKDFQFVVKYKMACQCQRNNSSVEFLCEGCRVLLDNEIVQWEEAQKIILEWRNNKVNSKELLFGDEKDDLKESIYTTIDNFCGNGEDKDKKSNGMIEDNWDKIEVSDSQDHQEKDVLNTSGSCVIV